MSEAFSLASRESPLPAAEDSPRGTRGALSTTTSARAIVPPMANESETPAKSLTSQSKNPQAAVEGERRARPAIKVYRAPLEDALDAHMSC